MSGPSKDDTPTAVLMAEHQVILRVIAVLGRLIDRAESDGRIEFEALRSCVEFFRFFADACHHAKEEDLLFPVLEDRGIPREGGPIGVMLYEHTVARGLTRDMGDALEAARRGEVEARKRLSTAARQYIELLTNHIYKEDHVLFAMGEQAMTDEDRTSLCSKFREVGRKSFGGKRREDLEHLADQLERDWPAG